MAAALLRRPAGRRAAREGPVWQHDLFEAVADEDDEASWREFGRGVMRRQGLSRLAVARRLTVPTIGKLARRPAVTGAGRRAGTGGIKPRDTAPVPDNRLRGWGGAGPDSESDAEPPAAVGRLRGTLGVRQAIQKRKAAGSITLSGRDLAVVLGGGSAKSGGAGYDFGIGGYSYTGLVGPRAGKGKGKGRVRGGQGQGQGGTRGWGLGPVRRKALWSALKSRGAGRRVVGRAGILRRTERVPW